MIPHRTLAAAALLCAAALAACASDINRKQVEIHFAAAQRYDVGGDFVSARDQYWKALVAARSAELQPAAISMLTYNFGRTAGYTCRLEVAERHLLEALEMEKDITGPDSGISTKRIFELARYYYDQGKYQQAATYYASGLPKIEALGIRQEDPITLADAYDEYASALALSGRGAEAAAPRHQAEALRKEHPGVKAQFTPTRYKCAAAPV